MMIHTDDAFQAPQLPTSRDMAQVLAAIVVLGPEVDALVSALAPWSGGMLLEELAQLARGELQPDETSVVLRWVLPEIHAELGRRFPVASA